MQYLMQLTTSMVTLHCKNKCRKLGFPIELAMTKNESKRAQTASHYNYTHRLKGQAKCKLCNYITANPIEYGTRCPCCGMILARSIYHKTSRMIRDIVVKRVE